MSEQFKRIGHDLNEIASACFVAKPPAGVPDHRVMGWRLGWLHASLAGYAQTELGAMHGSGEDCSLWREEAERIGIDFSLVHGPDGPPSPRDVEQQRLYAEVIAPRIVSKALAAMRGEVDV